jgi:ferredoxin
LTIIYLSVSLRKGGNVKVRELLILTDRCNGCGVCARDSPNIFYMTPDGKAAVKKSVDLTNPQLESAASYAIEKCGSDECGKAGAIWGRGEGEMPGVRQ